MILILKDKGSSQSKKECRIAGIVG